MNSVHAITDNRILIVEDTPANIQTLTAILKGKGYQISVATNGKQALEVLARIPSDLILLDIMMPEMDGFETCQRLKAEERWREIPVIFLTAKTETDDIVKGFELGAVDYITKPFNPHELLSRVNTHLALRRQQRQLQENFERLSELERLRDNLVHMVVHDLRSPLLGLSGCLQMLQMDLEEKLEATQAEDLESALTAAQRLSEMVTSLLDVSRLEAGEMPLHKQTGDIRPVVVAAIESLGGLTKGRRVTYSPPDQPVILQCDSEVVTRIVANLVGNALKFTPTSGEVRLTTTLDGTHIRTAITDTGPGIPPDYRERIFEKFGQVTGRDEGRKYSTGLGLTFCKLAVEAHGGTIGVDSVVGEGSTFWFILPIGQISESQ